MLFRSIAGNGNMDRIGNINIIQVVDVAGNGNMVRIGKYYRKWKYCRNRKYCRKRKYCQKRKYYRNRKIIPKTEILNICSKRKLIPESEILNIVRIGNEFRNREFNRKRIVRISIGRGLPDEGPARSQAIAQQAKRATRTAKATPGPAQGQAHQAMAARAARAAMACELCSCSRGLAARVGGAAV